MTDAAMNAIHENAELASAIAHNCECVHDDGSIGPLCPACEMGHDADAIKHLVFQRRYFADRRAQKEIA